MLAPRQIPHRTHLQRWPFAFGLAVIRAGLVLGAGCAAAAGGRSLLGTALPFTRIGGGCRRFLFTARIGTPPQALGLGDSFKLVIQLGAKTVG
jgi:hypothetical protein